MPRNPILLSNINIIALSISNINSGTKRKWRLNHLRLFFNEYFHTFDTMSETVHDVKQHFSLKH